MRLHSFAFAASLAALGSAPALADTITLEQTHKLVDAELDLVAKTYVFPERRDAIVSDIRARESAGAYELTNPAELADKLTGDMVAVSHDKHMWVQYDPAQYQGLTTHKDDEGAAYLNDVAARENYGYAELKILPGNIRYLNCTTFNWEMDRPPAAIADAARFLSGGDAVIIDLRQNGGGSGEAVRDLVSYFMPDRDQVLMRYYDGVSGRTDTNYVDRKLDGPRMVGKPLYVLTSPNTGSAAEEFADHVKLFKLGTLVGETTAGAGNNDTITPLPPGFVVSISTGRPIHPVDKTGWEGIGIAPDVATTADTALDKAQLLALQKLAAAPGADAKQYAWAIAGEEARANPPARLSDAALAAYAGKYGIRTITLKDGTLIFQRDGRPQKKLTRMSGDAFALGTDDTTRLHFKRTAGKITGFDMETVEGDVIPVARTN